MHKLDFVERIRRVLWPVLGFEGEVSNSQYVGTLNISVEDFEEVLHRHGAIRNGPAYYKHAPDHQSSAGSWVFLPDGYFGTWQIHVTLFPDGDVYVHREYNWRRHPIKHLREEDMSAPVQKWRSNLYDWQISYDVEPRDQNT